MIQVRDKLERGDGGERDKIREGEGERERARRAMKTRGKEGQKEREERREGRSKSELEKEDNFVLSHGRVSRLRECLQTGNPQ